jgi:hypothetical protein
MSPGSRWRPRPECCASSDTITAPLPCCWWCRCCS